MTYALPCYLAWLDSQVGGSGGTGGQPQQAPNVGCAGDGQSTGYWECLSGTLPNGKFHMCENEWSGERVQGMGSVLAEGAALQRMVADLHDINCRICTHDGNTHALMQHNAEDLNGLIKSLVRVHIQSNRKNVPPACMQHSLSALDSRHACVLPMALARCTPLHHMSRAVLSWPVPERLAAAFMVVQSITVLSHPHKAWRDTGAGTEAMQVGVPSSRSPRVLCPINRACLLVRMHAGAWLFCCALTLDGELSKSSRGPAFGNG